MGFLEKIGLKTSIVDRVFLSVIIFIAIGLLWLRFLEEYLSIWYSVIVSLIVGIIIVKWG